MVAIRITRTSAEIEAAIVTIRGKRVMVAADLAAAYGVEHRALNQAVRRNRRKFPSDFAFRLTSRETAALSRLRSQSVIIKNARSRGRRPSHSARGAHSKYLPMAFTEHGVIMAANLLRSARAVRMSLLVVRAFVQLRRVHVKHAQVVTSLAAVERRLDGHDQDLRTITNALRALIDGTSARARPRIGFVR